MSHYELWDTETRNLVEYFDSKEEAFTAIREIANLSGLALARRGANGTTVWIGHGSDLTQLAERGTAV